MNVGGVVTSVCFRPDLTWRRLDGFFLFICWQFVIPAAGVVGSAGRRSLCIEDFDLRNCVGMCRLCCLCRAETGSGDARSAQRLPCGTSGSENQIKSLNLSGWVLGQQLRQSKCRVRILE